jgi:hypothetical protein
MPATMNDGLTANLTAKPRREARIVADRSRAFATVPLVAVRQ